jgi:heterodisulfide reductase subunit B2
MKYAYYPGCSLSGSAVEYDVATRAVCESLSISLTEIPDWTCCGASAVEPVSSLLTYALPARNLALSGMQMPDADVLVPCSACYLNLLKAVEAMRADPGLHQKIRTVLETESLSIKHVPRVRHLLDVLVNEVDPELISDKVLFSLNGLTIAPYYGCQILRPYVRFDDPEVPSVMNRILEALGATVHEWTFGNRCCGASLMATYRETALHAVADLLLAAQGADAIATVCPMCQMNLEAYQREAGQYAALKEDITIIYLPQLMGIAFGLPEDRIRMTQNIMVTPDFREKIMGLQSVSA